MRTLLSFLALGLLALSPAATAQYSVHVLHDDPDVTSGKDWLVMVRITDLGTIFDWRGYFPEGIVRDGDCNRTISATDPGGKPDTVLTGTSKIGSWTVKANYSSTGEITRIWGQDATGEFWTGSLVTRKIIPHDRRANRQGSRRNID